MSLKTTAPWTAGRKKGKAGEDGPRVVCVGGRCTWEIGWLGGTRPKSAKVLFAVPMPPRPQA